MIKEEDLLIKNVELNKVVKNYKRKLKSGNFKRVVLELYNARGLTAQDFAKILGFNERAILDIQDKGFCSEKLLDEICKYFSLVKTDEFKSHIRRLPQRSEKTRIR
ncbi:hypothetical protein [Peribacillus loiseleuriae]|uniref:hypothetical protein n=1 Tax=Peribacillus loiseleuriae TaxID=1679170 RepID=UPI003D003DE4